tara:strand:+ start:877 stop:1221 length:345 start_codon:yes stop_codon:yes gene_type:complete
VRDLITSIVLFTIGQVLIWFQTNAQFLSEWAKENPFMMSCVFSIPISYLMIHATALVVEHFDGLLWPGRFIGFAAGIITFAFLSYIFMGEGISAKTGVSLLLSVILVLIQVFWK